MAYGDDEALLGGGNKWVNALALLGATMQDISAAQRGRQGNALLGAQQRMAAQKKQAEEADQKSAQAALLGGLDPTSGITWNQPRQGTSTDDQKALFMRAFPEAGAKAAAASLFPKPSPWEEVPLAGGAAQPAAGAPPLLGGGQPPVSAPLLGAGNGGTTTTVRPSGPAASAGGFGAALAQSENSGRVSGFNRHGYGGKYQFGEAALQDAGVYTPGSDPKDNAWLGQFNVPGMPEVKTAKDFFGNEAAQDAVFGVYKGGLEKQIADRGLDRFVGQTVGGAPITKDGIVAMMHLGGPTGAERFLTSGGTYNPADSNGTRLSDYASKFARTQVAQANTGTMSDAGPAVTMPAPQASPPSATPASAPPLAAPSAPAAQPGRTPTVGVRRNRETGDVQYYDTTTRMPLSAPPTGFRYTPYGMEADPAYLQAELQLRAASRPQTNVTVNGQNEGAKTAYELTAKSWQSADEAARSANRREGMLQTFEAALPAFRTGAGADTRLRAQQALEGLGIKFDSTAPGEVLQSIQKRIELENTPRGQGAITENERGLVRDVNNLFGSTPEGAQLLISATRQLDRYDRQVAEVYRESARRNGGIPNPLEVSEGVSKLPPPMDPQLQQQLMAMAQQAKGGAPAPAPGQTQAPQAPSRADIEAELRRRGKL